MKKYLKPILIALLSLFVFLTFVVLFVCYFVFTPSRLTPIVSTQLNKELTCNVQLSEVELTFFSTFPHFTLSISDAIFFDTDSKKHLLSVKKLHAAIDIYELLINKSIIIDAVRMQDGDINLRVDSQGNANFDILPASSEPKEDNDGQFEFPTDNINLNNVVFDNIFVLYKDETSELTTCIDSLFCSLDGLISKQEMNFKTKLNLAELSFQLRDSLVLSTFVQDISLGAEVSMHGEKIVADIAAGLFVDSLDFEHEQLLNNTNLQFDFPIELNLNEPSITLNNTSLKLNSISLILDGIMSQNQSDELVLNIDASSNYWDFDSLLCLVPPTYSYLLDNVRELDGSFVFDSKIVGIYSDSVLPTVQANIKLHDVNLDYVGIPYELNNLNSSMLAFVDLNDQATPSTIDVKEISGNFAQNSFSISGKVDDLLHDINCSLSIAANLNLSTLFPLIPNDLPLDLKGNTVAKIHTHFHLNELMNGEIDCLTANAQFDYSNLNVVYNDSMQLTDKKGKMSFEIPSTRKQKIPNELIEISLTASDMQFSMTDFVETKLEMATVKMAVSDPFDTKRMPSAECNFFANELSLLQDSIEVNTSNLQGRIALHASEKGDKKPIIKLDYSSSTLDVSMPELVVANTKHIAISATSIYDKSQNNQILKWNPSVNVDFNEGHFDFVQSDSKFSIPIIRFDLTPEVMNIDESRIILDDSDFSLSGQISNISKFMSDEDLLMGELNYYSTKTNVDQIMDFVDGFGTEEVDVSVEAQDMPETATDSKPFMVPKGVDIALNTHIDHAIFNSEPINNINGKLTVNDGKLVLEQMGFTSNAAEMLLTAVYRSERENHLYAGFNFHLLDIDIAHLIDLIPIVDSIMPMLNSFEGKGEFHFAGETYLKSNYEPKISTLRAAAAIEGKDLVLLDSETFDQISKMLMFSRKSENVIDSLSVEATVYKDEVDLYPFLLTMDKWQAVISGRHNMDMSFNYHVSLTDCPLPVRLGLDIKGNFDDMKYDLVPCKFKSLYKPDKQNIADKRTLEMKRIISESLKRNLDDK